MTRTSRTLVVLAVTSLLVSSCGTMTAGILDTIPRYTDVSDESKARLRTIYDMFDDINIAPNGICSKLSESRRATSRPIAKSGVNIISGNAVTFEEKLLGMPLQPFPLEPNSSRVFSEFYIPAGREIVISLASRARGPGGFYCPGKRLAFAPKPGRDYEAQIVMTNSSCFYVLTELSEYGRVPVTDSLRAVTDDDCKK